MKLDGAGPLFKQFQRLVVQQIADGDYRPGERLPSEAEFMKRYGLSRQTISKALSELAERGMLERNKRAGTSVAMGYRPAAPTRNEILTELIDHGALYEYRILALQEHRNGEGQIRWAEVPLGTRFLQVELLHLLNNSPAQHERRFVNLDLVPIARGQSFTDEPPAQWLLANAPWSWVQRRIRAVNAQGDLARLLAVPEGAACVVLERRMFRDEGLLGLAYLTHPGDRFVLSGDVGLVPAGLTARPKAEGPSG